MDLGNLNTKAPAAEGAAMHLHHPVLGHALYTNKDGETKGADEQGRLKEVSKADPVRVWVRGAEAPSVQKKLKVLRRKAVKRKPGAGGEAEDGVELVMAMIIRFEGLSIGGEPLADDEDGKRAFIEMSDDFVRQVTDFAQDSSNFFKDASAI